MAFRRDGNGLAPKIIQNLNLSTFLENGCEVLSQPGDSCGNSLTACPCDCLSSSHCSHPTAVLRGLWTPASVSTQCPVLSVGQHWFLLVNSQQTTPPVPRISAHFSHSTSSSFLFSYVLLVFKERGRLRER